MTLILSLITGAAGLLIRFLPGGTIARLALGLIKHWRALAIGALALVIFGCGLRSGYLGGYTRGLNRGFEQGVEHHAQVIAEENVRRAALAVEAERTVVAQTDSVRRAAPSLRDAKLRLCKLDDNCEREQRVRKPRRSAKVAPRRQLADDQGNPSGERPAPGLLR